METLGMCDSRDSRRSQERQSHSSRRLVQTQVTRGPVNPPPRVGDLLTSFPVGPTIRVVL